MLHSERRVCIIIDYPHHYRFQFFESLADAVHLNIIFASPGGTDREGLTQFSPKKATVTFLSAVKYQQILNHIWPSLVLFVRSLREIVAARPHIVVVHGYSNPACWSALLLRPLRLYKLIIWGESNRFDKPRHAVLELIKSAFLLGCDQAHVYGASARDYFVSLRYPKANIYVVQPTVLDAYFTTEHKRLRTDHERRLLYVGRFAPEKNLIFLLNGLKAYLETSEESALTLSLVGFGPMETQLREHVQRLDLGARVHFLGRVQQKDLPSVIAQHDVLTLPSLSETYGLVTLEAMLVGVPALVSTRCGCQADLITNSTGWTFDPTCAESLRNALLTIDKMSDSELNLRANAARVHAMKFSTEHSVSLTLEALAKWL